MFVSLKAKGMKITREVGTWLSEQYHQRTPSEDEMLDTLGKMATSMSRRHGDTGFVGKRQKTQPQATDAGGRPDTENVGPASGGISPVSDALVAVPPIESRLVLQTVANNTIVKAAAAAVAHARAALHRKIIKLMDFHRKIMKYHVFSSKNHETTFIFIEKS